MTPTDDLRAQFRRMTDEVIPAGGSDAQTRFSDAEVDELLTAAASPEEAAANGWQRKAARAMSERGGLQESSVGSERLKFVSIESYRDHCLAMAAQYRAQAPIVGGFAGSRLLGTVDPDVLGVTVVEVDLKRLVAFEV